MKCYYRISDHSYTKPKLFGTSKKRCLENFLEVFQTSLVVIVADRCHADTINWLKSINRSGYHVCETDLGNAQSLKYCLNTASTQNISDECIYFVEDDYIHKPGAEDILRKAIYNNRSHYYTLYDHPDKYSHEYNFGETSKVFKVENQHWRHTQSTTMTFGCLQKTIAEDLNIWNGFLTGQHPPDHEIFTKLNQDGKKLAVAIPGHAYHCDLTWGNQNNQITIEPWVLNYLSVQKDALA